jgi:3-hydroxyacyl-CoA dehydrogenase/enoyl-CoA hydratase/3-hydroxybutyryl-CoA epimerase
LDQQIRTTLHRDGVLVATIDMPGRRMNVFSEALMDALGALMDRVDADADVRCVVLTSGKPAFLAGADLSMVCGFTDAAGTLDEPQLIELCGRLGKQFVRLENSTKPWVAAINGIALGGGLELAMACRERIVVDDPRIQLGLPEVRWGLLPGAGGTQRLPRLAGFRAGLEMLLIGRSVSPAEARQLGMMSQTVGADELLAVARKRALDLCAEAYDPVRKFAHYAQQDVPPPEQARALAQLFNVPDERYRNYPAYSAIINCVLLGARRPLDEATAIEMQQFIGLMRDPVAGNMVRTLFLNRQLADKELAAPAGLSVVGVLHGVLPEAWKQALSRSKLEVGIDESLPDGMIDVADSSGAHHRVCAAELSTAAGDVTHPPLAVLSPVTDYGRVLEIVGAGDSTRSALAALSPRLQALPWPTAGTHSVLAALSRAAAAAPDAALDAQAVVALRACSQGDISDPVLLDVAACAAGVCPAYSGGPFAYLYRHRERLGGDLPADLREAWTRVEPKLREAYP